MKRNLENRNIILLNPPLNLEQDDITRIPRSSNNVEMLVFEPLLLNTGVQYIQGLAHVFPWGWYGTQIWEFVF